MKGAWSLPGGALKLSECIQEGVVREVLEETGVEVRALELIEALDRISHDPSGRVLYHYVLLDWLCTPRLSWSGESSTEPVASSDAEVATWADLNGLEPFQMEAVTLRVIRTAECRARELGL